MTPFEESKLRHQVLSQFHRWFQIYERPFNEKRIQNQLAILSDDILIESAAGISKGKNELPKRLELFIGWLNAHHIINAVIDCKETNQISLKAEILYQSIRADQTRHSNTLQYNAILTSDSKDLPLFKQVKITPTGAADASVFEDTYPENRARSFLHYWCYCIESFDGDTSPFNELLAQEFELDFGPQHIARDIDRFKEWLLSGQAKLIERSHYPVNFKAIEKENNTIHVSVDFDWQALNLDNEPMHAKTHHEWVLENNMDERFARIKHMRVTQTEPFVVIQPE